MFGIKLYEIKPLDWKQRKYIMGNYRTFGFTWRTTMDNICLMSPIINMIYNWKYRNYNLVVDEEFMRTQHCQLVKDSKDE